MSADSFEALIAFPTHIYSIEKPEFLETSRTVSYDYLKNSEKNSALYPFRMSDSFEMDDRIQEFASFVALSAGNILADQGYNVNGLGAYFASMWTQEHHFSSGMDQHTHPGVQIVGFYFIDVPENSSDVLFFDPRAGKVAAGIAETNITDITLASNSFLMKPKEGLLILTNSWLPHAFTRHGNENPLRFIHFNIDLTLNPRQEQPIVI